MYVHSGRGYVQKYVRRCRGRTACKSAKRAPHHHSSFFRLAVSIVHVVLHRASFDLFPQQRRTAEQSLPSRICLIESESKSRAEESEEEPIASVIAFFFCGRVFFRPEVKRQPSPNVVN